MDALLIDSDSGVAITSRNGRLARQRHRSQCRNEPETRGPQPVRQMHTRLKSRIARTEKAILRLPAPRAVVRPVLTVASVKCYEMPDGKQAMPDEVPVLVTELKIETQTASWRSDSAPAKPRNAPVSAAPAIPCSASWYGHLLANPEDRSEVLRTSRTSL